MGESSDVSEAKLKSMKKKKNLQKLDRLTAIQFEATTAYIDYLIANGAKEINIETRGGKFSIASDNILPREKMESAEYQSLVRALYKAFRK